MNITVNGKELELEFTFNSFKYLEDFDIQELQDIETKPFKVLKILTQLLYGAMNSNPKERFGQADVDAVVEEIAMTGDLPSAITDLVGLLEDSNFFKALQVANK